jgi:hypothetical protein
LCGDGEGNQRGDGQDKSNHHGVRVTGVALA